VKPAVQGFLDILEAAHKFNVKRVVNTGSVGSVLDYAKDGDYSCDETQFTDENGVVYSYTKSKILQEKETWKAYKKLAEKGKCPDVVFVLPTMMAGPVLLKDSDSVVNMLKMMLDNKYRAMPPYYGGVADVRMAAKMHLVAIDKGRTGERYIVSGDETMKFSELGKILAKKYKKYGYKCTEKDVGCFGLWLFGMFDPFTKYMYKTRNRKINLKVDKAKKEFGLEAPPVEETLYDMAESLIENGYVEDLRKDYKEEEKN
jgi:dihydroflavonol-4-reductase